MTNQEMFDRVVDHAKQMRSRCIDGDSGKYRSEDGQRCFAGALVPDEDYHPGLEGRLASEVLRSCSGKLADELQGIHDNYEIDVWADELACTAERWHLWFDRQAFEEARATLTGSN